MMGVQGAHPSKSLCVACTDRLSVGSVGQISLIAQPDRAQSGNMSSKNNLSIETSMIDHTAGENISARLHKRQRTLHPHVRNPCDGHPAMHPSR